MRLEKEMPAGNSTALSHSDQPPQPSAGTSRYTLRQLLADVKDHTLSEIEIAPALYRDAAHKPFTQPANAISKVSLGGLRGSVNPFWKYYGSRTMKAAKKEDTSVTQVLQESGDSKPILHVPSLSKMLYNWILTVNDSGKRFPETEKEDALRKLAGTPHE